MVPAHPNPKGSFEPVFQITKNEHVLWLVKQKHELQIGIGEDNS